MKTCFYCAGPTNREPAAIICWSCDKARSKTQLAAYIKVRQAISLEQLAPVNTQYCVDCGGFARVYDHRDYSKPVEVQPVCNSCNVKRGPAKFARAA